MIANSNSHFSQVQSSVVRACACCVLVAWTFGFHAPQVHAQWTNLPTGTQASYRGLAAINSKTAWVCGSDASVLRTVDGGEHWISCPIPNHDKTEFRAIHAWDDQQAVIASAGQPSVILKTIDGGRSWKLAYRNTAPEAFLDGLRFWDEEQGMAFGDPIAGELLVLITHDRGDTWLPANETPVSMSKGEAAFAASNSSLCLYHPKEAMIGLGGADGPAVLLRSIDQGKSWSRTEVAPIPRTESSGIFSLAIDREGMALAVGGDYKRPDEATGHIAMRLADRDEWIVPKGPLPRGYRSSVAIVASGVHKSWITVGPSGAERSSDGHAWTPLGDQGFHALAVGLDGSVWACGGMGRVARLNANQ